MSRFDLGQHTLEAGTIIVRAGVAIIHKEHRVREVVLFGVFQKDGLLRRDLSRCVSAKNSDASRLQLHSSQSGCLATPFISHFIPMINKRHPFILGASL